MQNKQLLIIGVIFLVAILGAGAVYITQTPSNPGKYDTFATCIKDSGTTFYGAFWCPHCREQKAMFGRSSALLPYVECSTPDGKDVLPVCVEKKVESYPTWVFPDGSRQSGTLTLETLAEKTKCELPK